MRFVTSDGKGNVLSVLPTDEPSYSPLDRTGVLATLLVVTDVLNIEDAANAAGTTELHLQHEAQAWAIG